MREKHDNVFIIYNIIYNIKAAMPLENIDYGTLSPNIAVSNQFYIIWILLNSLNNKNVWAQRRATLSPGDVEAKHVFM